MKKEKVILTRISAEFDTEVIIKVTKENGDPVTGLKSEDFKITDNNKEVNDIVLAEMPTKPGMYQCMHRGLSFTPLENLEDKGYSSSGAVVVNCDWCICKEDYKVLIDINGTVICLNCNKERI